MRYYESLYIVNPNFEQSRIDEVMKLVSDKCGDYKFKIINHHTWGKKRLAYSIQKHKYGSFILLHFASETADKLKEFDRFMYLNKDILRNQTVVLNQEPEVSSDDEYKKKNDEPLNEVDKKADESVDEDSNDKVDKKADESVDEDSNDKVDKKADESV
ncbi:MAG: 30S ribosomal protein S6, partial [Candidatus Neomarinimicrobiota bacterium]|nr:30S ribosomal protein S6 [Candidatus Neomarinimicrobiota bacterium]